MCDCTITGQYSLNCARQLGDQDFLHEYGYIDFVPKEVMYHKTCRLMYNNYSRGARIENSSHV